MVGKWYDNLNDIYQFGASVASAWHSVIGERLSLPNKSEVGSFYDALETSILEQACPMATSVHYIPLWDSEM